MNIAYTLRQQAEKQPMKRAVVFPHAQDERGRMAYTHLTFAQLEMTSDYAAHKLKSLGVKPQTKVLLFVKPSIEFSVLSFALMKLGATLVLIDPGMGKRNLLRAITEVAPDVLIAVPEVCLARWLYPKVFRTVELVISTGHRTYWKTLSVDAILPSSLDLSEQIPKGESFPIYPPNPQDICAIIFTSGGTGRPKGVIYHHSIFRDQMTKLQTMFQLKDSDIDMPAFPLFSLFTIGMGLTSVIPVLDASKPSTVNPEMLVKVIYDQGVTFAAGSPAIWDRVATYCHDADLTLPTIKSLVMFGAPVRMELHEQFQPLLPLGTTYTPYGATECLPVSSISGRELLEPKEGGEKSEAQKSREGMGTCVGYPVAGTEIRIIEPGAEAIGDISQAKFLAPFEIGEVIVSGTQVTPGYLGDEPATQLAKIPDLSSKGPGKKPKFWHRMGDVGYLDDQGKLWFCGRLAHRVTTPQGIWDSIPTESAFLSHPEVKRVALIALRTKQNQVLPAIVVERRDGLQTLRALEKDKFKGELLSLAKSHRAASEIAHFLLYAPFPVDTRHNIKIDRQSLGQIFAHQEGKCL